MSYIESDTLPEEKNFEDETEPDLSPSILDIEDEELDALTGDSALDVLNKKSRSAPVRFSLEKRRRIEELQEERRFNKEFGYGNEIEALEKSDDAKSE